MEQDFIRHDDVRLKVTAFEGGILRVQAGGLDGYQDSLLNRYGIIEPLAPCAEARWHERTLELPDGHRLKVGEDLSFRLLKNETLLLATGPGHQPATAPTVYQNRGFSAEFSLHPEEKLIGFGDQYRKGFLLNGQRESLWIRNQSDYVPVPFYMSSRGYGILFNTTRRLFYDFGTEQAGRCHFHVADTYFDVYIVTGAPYEALINSYVQLTGRSQLPPMFTFGLWIVAHTEIRAHELLQLARAMRDEKIPCDLLALEPLWMEKLYDASLQKSWSAERFPYFPWVAFEDTMIGNLKAMGYHFGLWMLSEYDHTWEEERRIGAGQPDAARKECIIPASDLELVEQDDHFGHQPMTFDKMTKPEEPFYEHLKKFVDQGVDYFKQDGYALINLYPDRLYGNGRREDEMHNLHYMLYSGQMIRGFEAHTGRRAFGMMVAGTAGFQRYPGTWAGDTGGGAQALCAILQLATLGQACPTCDMEMTPEGVHMGLLLPWSQINSWASYSYPLYRGASLQHLFRAYIEQRMRWLLFYYSLARETGQSGKAIVRPMHLVYPDRAEAYELTHQFFIGDALLAGAYTDRLTLPPGRWLNYWTGEILTGDWGEQQPTVPEDRGGPLLVREGALIPCVPVQQFVGEKSIDHITWQVFPGTDESSFTLYLDDGIGLDHRQGAYAAALLRARPDAEGLTLSWDPVEGNEPERILSLSHTFEWLGDAVIRSAECDGRPMDVRPDPDTGHPLIGPVQHGQVIRVILHQEQK